MSGLDNKCTFLPTGLNPTKISLKPRNESYFLDNFWTILYLFKYSLQNLDNNCRLLCLKIEIHWELTEWDEVTGVSCAWSRVNT